MRIRSFSLTLLCFMFPIIASAESYQLELNLDIPKENGGGTVVGHDAVIVKVTGKSMDDAVKKATALVGTQYTKPVSATNCRPDAMGTKAEDGCNTITYNLSYVLGATVMNGRGGALCTVGKAVASGVTACPDSGTGSAASTSSSTSRAAKSTK